MKYDVVKFSENITDTCWCPLCSPIISNRPIFPLSRLLCLIYLIRRISEEPIIEGASHGCFVLYRCPLVTFSATTQPPLGWWLSEINPTSIIFRQLHHTFVCTIGSKDVVSRFFTEPPQPTADCGVVWCGVVCVCGFWEPQTSDAFSVVRFIGTRLNRLKTNKRPNQSDESWMNSGYVVVK